MALIKKSSKQGVTAVWEDPVTGSNYIYLDNEGHNKTTLAPIMNASALVRNDSTGPADHLVNDAYFNYYDEDAGYSLMRAGEDGLFHLTKETIHDKQHNITGNDQRNNVNITHRRSLDPDNIGNCLKAFSKAGGGQYVSRLYKTNHYNWYEHYGSDHAVNAPHVDAPDYMYPSYGGTTSTNTTLDLPQVVTGFGETEARIALITADMRVSYNNRPMEGVGRWQADGSSVNVNIEQKDNYYVQYIGRSLQTSKPLYLYNSIDNEHSQYIEQFDVGSDTCTQLHFFSAAPTTTGTLYGGARGYSTIGKTANWGSKHFYKTGDSDTKIFYLPYFDANYDYHPWVFEWNQTNDTFTRLQATNITGDASTTHMSGQINKPGDHASFASCFFNETFVNGGNRYLSVMPVTSQHLGHDASDLARTFLSYSVSSSDATALTYHSKVIIPKTPRNMLFLNDANTLMGVLCKDVFYIYKWDNTNGWVKTGSIPGTFVAVGRDSTDRIWAYAASNEQWGEIHIINPTTPIKVTITPASATYNHTGTTITSTVDVSAYDINGARVATSVALTIEGTTMTFGDDTKSATVTTSANAETSQAIKITGAGLSDIVANISL